MKKPSFFNFWPFTKSKGESPRRIIPTVRTVPNGMGGHQIEVDLTEKSDLSELAQHLPKTREEWFSELPEPVRSYVYREREKQKTMFGFYGLTDSCYSIFNAVNCFDFDATEQGAEYWYEAGNGNYTKAADILRKQNVKPKTSHDFDADEVIKMYNKATDKCEQCLIFYPNLTYTEIAAKTGLSHGSTRSALLMLKRRGIATHTPTKSKMVDGVWYASWSKV